MPRLVIFRGDDVHRVVELSDGDVRIGRGEQNDFVLPDEDKLLSRFHAELRYERGRYVLLDLNSQNGIWVNGQRQTRIELRPDHPVTIGGYRLIFEDAAPAGVLAAPQAPTTDNPALAPTETAADDRWAETVAAQRRVPPADRPPVVAPPPPVPAAPRVTQAPVTRPASKAQRTTGGATAGGGAGPIAWLARQPKPVLFGGFAAIALLVVALGQVFGPDEKTSAGQVGTAGTTEGAAPAETNEEQVARHLADGKVLIARGEYADAILDHFDRVLLIDPTHPEALDLKSQAEEALRRATAEPIIRSEPLPAVSATESAAPEPPKPPARPPSVTRGTVPNVARRPGESTADWRARSQATQQRYDQAKGALEKGDHAVAVEGFEGIVRDEPGYRDVAARLVRAREGLAAAGREQARNVLAASADLEAAGDYRAALVQLEKAKQLDPSAEEVDAALQRVRTRMDTVGDDAFTRARQYDALGRITEAIALYERALQFFPPDHPNRTMATDRIEALRAMPR